MSLKDSFKNYVLTKSQETLIEKLEVFLSDDSSCFLLKGYAGTGKTFMMKGLTDYLAANNRTFKIAAPTGRAAKVISQKTKRRAYTLHKTIYSGKDLKEFKTKDVDGTETYKFYYELKNNEDPANTVFIVDESSMISNIYSEGEFFRFGSGFLLNDFVNYINIDNNDHNKKIIFIGDNAQLPPVNMNFSPALDAKYLNEVCNVVAKEYELTEVVRQKTESGVLFNATKIRQAIKANSFSSLDLETQFLDIHKTKHEELLEKYLLACGNKIDDETIIIAYSNNSVKEYNDFVRNHFFPSQQFLTPGDKVILVSNNYNYQEIELLNGDFGKIIEVTPEIESRTIRLKNKKKEGKVLEKDVHLSFRDVVIEFTDNDQIKHNIQCKIIENLLYSDKRDLSSDELKAIYIDFKIRNDKLKPGTKEFKDALRADKYFNALRIKFGYAVTCHKAQGGEWKNTFLNCKTSMGYFNSSYFRWLYTGITRASEKLFTIDEPHFKAESNFVQTNTNNSINTQDKIILNEELVQMVIPFKFPEENPYLKNIFLAIFDILKESKIQINAIKHTSYLEHYIFSQGEEYATFKIHYNGQNKISSIEKPTNSSQISEIVYSGIQQLINKVIIIPVVEESNASEKHFEFDEDFLKDFYENIKSKTNKVNITISNIEHYQYNEVYEFKKNGFVATYKFWYNGKNAFKKVEIVNNKTTGLTEEINALL
jgi:hypothetical protein